MGGFMALQVDGPVVVLRDVKIVFGQVFYTDREIRPTVVGS